MQKSYRLPAVAVRPRRLWSALLARLSHGERVKRQLEKGYQQRASRRLRESGMARA